MIKANYHNHLYLCRHGEGEPADYIEKAIANHYEVLGISDHGFLPVELKDELNSRRMEKDEYFNIYLPSLKEAKEKYKDQIKVLSSIEIEYVYNDEMMKNLEIFDHDLDYLVLGQHFYYDENDNLKKIVSHKFNKDFCFDKIIIDKYFKTLLSAIETKKFKVLAHPDLIMKLYPKLDDYMKAHFKKLVEICQEYGCHLEFNCNGLRHRTVFDMGEYHNLHVYPRLDLWDYLLKELHYEEAVINDDCHYIKDLCDDKTKWAYDYFEKNNYPFCKTININKE